MYNMDVMGNLQMCTCALISNVYSGVNDYLQIWRGGCYVLTQMHSKSGRMIDASTCLEILEPCIQWGGKMTTINGLWRDENGFIVSSELVLLASVILIPLLVGMQTVRDSVVQELGDVGQAIGSLAQSYWYGGVAGHCSFVSGSRFIDQPDQCENNWCNNRNCTNVCIACGQESGGGGSQGFGGGSQGLGGGGSQPLIWESGIRPGPPILYETPPNGGQSPISPVPEVPGFN